MGTKILSSKRKDNWSNAAKMIGDNNTIETGIERRVKVFKKRPLIKETPIIIRAPPIVFSPINFMGKIDLPRGAKVSPRMNDINTSVVISDLKNINNIKLLAINRV